VFMTGRIVLRSTVCGMLAIIISAFAARAAELGPEDVLMIEIWPDQRMNREVVVSEDGSISLAGIGRIQAAGMTERQLEDEIKALLEGDYLPNAQVTIHIKEYNSGTVKVLGMATKIGRVRIPKDCTLVELLVEVGGTLPSSDNRVIILRKPTAKSTNTNAAPKEAVAPPPAGETNTAEAAAEKPAEAEEFAANEKHGISLKIDEGEFGEEALAQYTRIVADLSRVRNGERECQIRVYPGDVIVFPSRGEMVVYVMGEMRSGGMYQTGPNTTLIEALAMAGGPGPMAGDVLKVIKAKGDIKNMAAAEAAAKQAEAGVGSPTDIQTFSLAEIKEGGKGSDVILQNRDIILVPKSEESMFYVLGEVRMPGAYPIEKDLTVIKAISLAKGLGPLGDMNRVEIHRETPSGTKVIDAKLKDIVQPGDTIYVKQTIW